MTGVMNIATSQMWVEYVQLTAKPFGNSVQKTWEDFIDNTANLRQEQVAMLLVGRFKTVFENIVQVVCDARTTNDNLVNGLATMVGALSANHKPLLPKVTFLRYLLWRLFDKTPASSRADPMEAFADMAGLNKKHFRDADHLYGKWSPAGDLDPVIIEDVDIVVKLLDYDQPQRAQRCAALETFKKVREIGGPFLFGLGVKDYPPIAINERRNLLNRMRQIVGLQPRPEWPRAWQRGIANKVKVAAAKAAKAAAAKAVPKAPRAAAKAVPKAPQAAAKAVPKAAAAAPRPAPQAKRPAPNDNAGPSSSKRPRPQLLNKSDMAIWLYEADSIDTFRKQYNIDIFADLCRTYIATDNVEKALKNEAMNNNTFNGAVWWTKTQIRERKKTVPKDAKVKTYKGRGSVKVVHDPVQEPVYARVNNKNHYVHSSPPSTYVEGSFDSAVKKSNAFLIAATVGELGNMPVVGYLLGEVEGSNPSLDATIKKYNKVTNKVHGPVVHLHLICAQGAAARFQPAVGRALMEQFEKYAARLGARVLVLRSVPTVKTVRAYESLGYTRGPGCVLTEQARKELNAKAVKNFTSKRNRYVSALRNSVLAKWGMRGKYYDGYNGRTSFKNNDSDTTLYFQKCITPKATRMMDFSGPMPKFTKPQRGEAIAYYRWVINDQGKPWLQPA